RAEVEALSAREGKKEKYLFRCISEGRDYQGLYPRKKWPGVTPKLFCLYQVEICGRHPRILALACRLARQGSEGLRGTDLKRLRSDEAFTEPGIRNKYRSLIVRLAEEHELTFDDYLELFPLHDASGTEVGFAGWNLIRYYLHHTDSLQEGFSGDSIRKSLST